MTAGDIAAISRVHRAACLVAYRFMSWDYPIARIEAWYAGKFPAWDYGRVVERDGVVVAYLAATGGFLDQLFVEPAAQGQGIGRALLEAHLARGIRPVTLEVFEDNHQARRLYEGYGFRVVESYWNQDDGARELLMQLD